MIVRAEPGYSLVLMRRPEGDQNRWDLALAIRFPVVAWEYLGDGQIRPCLPFPFKTHEYIIETPTRMIVGYNSDTGGSIFADDLAAWLQLASLAQQPTQGNA